jgi:hypothetical protein
MRTRTARTAGCEQCPTRERCTHRLASDPLRPQRAFSLTHPNLWRCGPPTLCTVPPSRPIHRLTTHRRHPSYGMPRRPDHCPCLCPLLYDRASSTGQSGQGGAVRPKLLGESEPLPTPADIRPFLQPTEILPETDSSSAMVPRNKDPRGCFRSCLMPAPRERQEGSRGGSPRVQASCQLLDRGGGVSC